MRYVIALVLLAAGGLNSGLCAEDSINDTGFTSRGHTTDGLDVVQQRIEKKQAILIDVREEDEWDEGHLQAAHLVPLSTVRKGDLPDAVVKLLPKDKPVYCHCRSGGRVLAVSKVLKAKGYDVRPLAAGYDQLVEAGFTKAKSDKP
jgi:rhodanese-related sulfurtransferase